MIKLYILCTFLLNKLNMWGGGGRRGPISAPDKGSFPIDHFR